MTRSIKLLAVLVMVIGSATQALSNNDSTFYSVDFKIWSKEDGKYQLLYKNGKEENVKIKFLNSNNKTLYAEWVKSQKGFIKPFDLSQLPAGTYTIELVANKETLRETIVLASAQEKYADKVNVTELENEKKFELNVSDDVDSSLDLYIVDGNGEVLYSEKASKGNRVYNLTEVAIEEVTVLVYKDGEVIKASNIKF